MMNTCTCPACSEGDMEPGQCNAGRDGHGPCVDPWGLGCTCTGTAVDGECEGCWLWGK